jgi:hypothetical protein
MAAIKIKGVSIGEPWGIISEAQALSILNAPVINHGTDVLFRSLPDEIPEAIMLRVAPRVTAAGLSFDKLLAFWKARTWGDDGTVYNADEIYLIGAEDDDGNYRYFLTNYEL